MIMKGISRSKMLCYLLSFFIGGLYGYFIMVEGGRVIDYVVQNCSEGTERRLPVRLESRTGYHYTDSLANIRSGEVLPVRYEEMETGFVALDVRQVPFGVRAAGCLCGIALFACLVYSMRQARRFLTNVRKCRVFVFDNVRLLRRLGWALAVTWLFSFLFAYIDYRMISSLVDFENYRPSFNGISSLLYLMAGIFALLGAEIFNIGLKLQEEQDLTI